MKEKKALDPKCELVHILARWTWPVIFMEYTNVPLFVLDSNRFFSHRKGALKMDQNLDVCELADDLNTTSFTATLSDFELALVGGGIGDVVPA
jgi:hypothetical protein